jgi:hypothetical protein
MDWMGDVEGDAIAIYRRAGYEADRSVSVVRLVRELLHTEVMRAHLTGQRESDICTSNGKAFIAIRRGIAPARARWRIGHELAHWWYDLTGYRGEDIEARCDALGAALVVPRPAWLSLRRRVGDDVRELAASLATTQSLVLLRRGECEGTPTALVEPRRVIVRGWDFAWPDEAIVRRVARTGHPSLHKVTLTDEGRRVGLMAAA